MRIEQSFPTPIHGVSTLAPRSRPSGYATRQVNFRSDPINKLTRRPSSIYKELIAKVNDPERLVYHSYTRGGVEYSYLLNAESNEILCLQDDVLKDVVLLGNYGGENMEMFTIENDTYVLNRDSVVKKLDETDEENIKRVTHVNVTSALNYGETVKLRVTLSDGTTRSYQHVVPDLGTTEPDYDAADKARATSNVASSLADAINAPDSGNINVKAEALGSTVAVWEAGSIITGEGDWVHVEVENGQGDRTTVAINQVIESTDGLPLFAKVGTRITVRPDPTSNEGTYYLQAERIADVDTGNELEEVVWSENRSPYDKHSFDNSTLPRKISIVDDVYTIDVIPFKGRQSGDEETTPFPDFVGKTIESIGYFQKRLVFAAESSVYMTETDDLLNWFKQSAVRTLVTDPVGVTTSEMGADRILYLIPHNRDLMCTTSTAQFKISGSEAVTPQTVSMPLTTKYGYQESVPPVTMGNSVFFPMDYGDSTGIQEYSGQKNTSQDVAIPITNQVIGYLKGTATILAASPNLEMLVVATSGTAGNKLFVYEQYTQSTGKLQQRSWSEWELSKDESIVDVKFRRNELVVVTSRRNGDEFDIVTKTVPMNTRVTDSPIPVYLDNLLILETDGNTVTIPEEYDTTNCIAVRGKGTDYELWEVQFTRDANILTFDEDIGEGEVYIGEKFTSIIEPNRPFRYDEDGSTITSDKVRVSRWLLSLVDTHELSMTKTSTYSDPVTTKFESRFVGQYKLGSVNAYTGDWKFSFAESAELATATFFTDSYLSCTIVDIGWEGQYFQSKRRM